MEKKKKDSKKMKKEKDKFLSLKIHIIILIAIVILGLIFSPGFEVKMGSNLTKFTRILHPQNEV